MNGVELHPASEADLDDMVAIDDDACSLFTDAGLEFTFGKDHPFAQAEYARWRDDARAGRVTLARDEGRAVAFAALALVDGEAYLDQLSVRRAAMKRGIGSLLLAHAIGVAGSPLWLTTYGHLAWNGPWYARNGFVTVPERLWRPGIRHDIEQQRANLPAPQERVVMVRRS